MGIDRTLPDRAAKPAGYGRFQTLEVVLRGQWFGSFGYRGSSEVVAQGKVDAHSEHRVRVANARAHQHGDLGAGNDAVTLG